MSSATANDVINDVRTSNNASLPAMLGKSLPAAFRKFSPAKMRHNPVMFVVWVGAAFLTLLGVFQLFIPASSSVYGVRSGIMQETAPEARAALRPLMLSSATMHSAIGTCRREAAFKKISGAGLLFTTSSPQTEASIYWSMPDCFQYPSATRRVVEVATATLIECSFSQERNS